MRVVLYVRVSKVDLNPENQKLELEKYCKAMGYEYDVFEETESTRKTRPIKNKLFQEALQKKYDMVIVWKLDRWARSLQELINDLQLLQQRKVQFFAFKDNLTIGDDTNATGMLMLHILGAFAEFERAIIRERTMAGLDRARAEGKVLGRPRKHPIRKQNNKGGIPS